MIKELTKEQKAKMPEYVEKWISIGTNTDPLPVDTHEILTAFRALIKKDEVPTIIAENPIEAWVCCCLIESKVPLDKVKEEMVGVFNGNPKKYDIPKASLPYQTGSFFASVFSYYDYFIQETEVGEKIPEDLLKKYTDWQRTSELGCIYPLDSATVVCKKPTKIHLNENSVLHCDGGPALEYGGLGDFKCYSLNGIEVPEYLAVTPAEDLDLEFYKKEQNADVKAEFVRKVGIEMFLNEGTRVDTYENYDQEENSWWWKSEYEVWDMGFLFEGRYAPYLKMTNQTTGIFHIEGVSPQCRTVEDAVKERFGGRDMKIVNVA